MSKYRIGGGDFFDLPPGQECYYCGGKFTSQDTHFVAWHGWGAYIYLHPRCAVVLGTHLIKDGWAAQPQQVSSALKKAYKSED